MGFPSRKEINKVLKELEHVEGTLSLDPDASTLDRFRFDIQQKFVIFKRVNNMNQKQMADILGIDEAKVSKILHHRLDGFSTDRLIALYQKLDPKLKLKVS